MSKTSPRSVGSRSVGFRSVGSRSVQYQNFMSFHISKHKHSWGSRLSGREPQVSKKKSASDISFNPQFPHHGYNGIYMGYIWDIYGIYMGYIWDIYGIHYI